MSNFQKAALLLLKITGSAVITIGIIAFLQTRGERRQDLAENTFDSLKSSILSIFPDTDGTDVSSAVAAFSDTESNISEDTSPGLRGGADTHRKVTPMTSEDLKPAKPEFISEDKEELMKSKGLRKIIPEEFPESRIIEDYENEKKESQIMIKGDMNIDHETLGELISQSLTIALNEVKIPRAELKAMESKLANAEKFIDLKNLNFEKITAITARVGIFVALERKIKRIGIRLGGDESNNYYKPNIEINDDLEISKITPRDDCPDDIADEMIERIKRLPEYKKLSRKGYFDKEK